jgi:hypothetical protein
LTSPFGIVDRISKNPLVRRMATWMDAMAHPPLAIEISFDRLAAVRFGRSGSIEDFVVEPLPAGAILPSAVETKLLDDTHLKASRKCLETTTWPGPGRHAAASRSGHPRFCSTF